MLRSILGFAALATGLGAAAAQVQRVPAELRTSYLAFGARDGEGMLYESAMGASKPRVALVFAHPTNNNFNDPVARELAKRGYRVLTLNRPGGDERLDAIAPLVGRGVAWLRTLPGVEKVVLVGHSGGGPLMAFYQNVAENGPAACSGPEKIITCRVEGLKALPKADGIALLDPTLGAYHQMTSIDPAAGETRRDTTVDMFDAANGYDAATGKAAYSPDFRKRYLAAQATRGVSLTQAALARLKAIEAGQGRFSDDEPFAVRGIGVHAFGARLYQPDTALLARTARPHLLLRADGTQGEGIVPSVRAPMGQDVRRALTTLAQMGANSTVRTFLAQAAIRTGPDYAITADSITGVDWASAFTSAPANARGITVPALVLTMSCHYLLVSGELTFDALASRDKSYAAVEGATHLFTPCRPQYGDTVKRSFDFVDSWLSKPGRF
ncbi:alpha/beta hydrolase [Sphingomonas sp. MG17]|uniref:Alpha/beta hydrolase n=1 Tax=Sphingomonas tagetis TaxID=2949092 RepID=A0A9X2HFF2_9SPHN|nr:alpha/beta hydrolase [Sphingomonas tagetis]MCP3729863.1 alpha/beta hydrolase [Sphingomonas tagetis]